MIPTITSTAGSNPTGGVMGSMTSCGGEEAAENLRDVDTLLERHSTSSIPSLNNLTMREGIRGSQQRSMLVGSSGRGAGTGFRMRRGLYGVVQMRGKSKASPVRWAPIPQTDNLHLLKKFKKANCV